MPRKKWNNCCLCLFLLCSPTKGILNYFYVRCIFRYPTLWPKNRKKNCQTQPIRQIRRYHSSICLTLGDIDFSSEKSEMGDILCIILGDYGMLYNLEEVSLGFQPENPVAFDTNNSTLNALKDNQFFGKSYKTTKPPSVSKQYKRLGLFGYLLTGHTKFWLEELPSGTIATYDQLRGRFSNFSFQSLNTWRRRKRFIRLSSKMVNQFMTLGRG